MAASKKSSTTTRKRNSAAAASKSTGRRVAKKKNKSYTFNDDIPILIALAVSMVLLLSNFNLAGSFGQFVAKGAFGLVGIMEYLVPFALFFVVLFGVINKNSKVAKVKIAAMIFTFALLCTFFQLVITSEVELGSSFGEIVSFSAKHRIGGGFVGALFFKLFSPLGRIAAFAVTVICIVIGVVLITERSIVTPIINGSKRVYLGARDDWKQYREEVKQRELEREQKRQEEEERLEKAYPGYAIKHKGINIPSSLREDEVEEPVEPVKKRGRRQVPEVSAPEINEPEYVSDNLNFMQDLNNVDMASVNPVIFSKDLNEFDVREELFPSRDERYFGQEKPSIGPEEETVYHPVSQPISQPVPEPVMQPVVQPVSSSSSDDMIHDLSRKIGNELAMDYPSEGYEAVDNVNADTYKPQALEPEAVSAPTPVPTPAPDLSAMQAELGREVKELVGAPKEKEYKVPPIYLLKPASKKASGGPDRELREVSIKLTNTLREFGVDAEVTNATKGPTVTQYEVTPKPGVKVRKIVDLQDDIKLSLAARDIRIEAPIPGKSAVGIEVPNTDKSAVNFRELIESKEFKEHPSNLCVAIGKDISGSVILADLAKMPHLLIAGSTGSGKSVCINTIIMSLIYKSKPSDVKMIMVDPKVVELKVYNHIPHLLVPVVTEPKKAAGALNWAVSEMDRRYNLFAKYNVRDLKGYNNKVLEVNKTLSEEERLEKLPQIVIIVDEMAELMMAAQSEVEASIVRLAQLARACGIHLVIATQRPTVNVITGLIKANIPSKIAFAVSSGMDSRTIIDRVGAENLLGKGDMLYFPGDYPNPVRVQGAYVSDEEVNAVTEFLEANSGDAQYNQNVEQQFTAQIMSESQAFGQERDAYFEQAGRFIIEKKKASIGLIQRMYKVGFNRAARIVDQLTEAGVVGPEEGTKPRKILMTMEEFEQLLAGSRED